MKELLFFGPRVWWHSARGHNVVTTWHPTPMVHNDNTCSCGAAWTY